MKKKKGFAFPSVFLEDDDPIIGPGDGPGPGYGTLTGDTGNSVGEQMNWETWKGNLGYQDLDEDGAAGAWNDYVAWWESQGWTPERFLEVNGTDYYTPRF